MTNRTICVMGRVLDQMDGLGIYSSNLLRCMFEKDTKTRYVILLRTTRNAATFEKFKNTETWVLPAPSKTWWDQVTVPLAARRAGADIIFNPKFSLPLFTRTPGVFVLHGSDWYANPGNYTWWDNIYVRIMMPFYLRKAARLLSISQIVIDDYVKYAGLNPSKVTLSYGAAGSHFRPMEDRTILREFAERHRLPERFILTVGRVYHTGLDRLIEYRGGNNERLVRGFQLYRERGGTLPLVIVGHDIERYLRLHGFDDSTLKCVHFTGFIPNTEIVKAYNLAQFFVLATLYESFCLPLVEAMASGCPAMVPSTGGCPEIAQGAARLVDPQDVQAIADGMFEMERSEDLRRQLKEAGLKRAKMFSWERTTEMTLRVLDEVAPRTGPAVQSDEK